MRVFSVPLSVPFLRSVIAALIDGRLIEGFEVRTNPEKLAQATLYLPTRRAGRMAREIFLDELATNAAILPRIVALVIALPILAFIGSMAALYGGGLVAWLYGGVDPEAFLLRLRDAISIDHFTVGLIKAPVMAAVIGIVACVEGLAVQGSAESLGQHTTSSVVKGIFFVIVMDGVFAIFFASIGM